MFSVHLTIKQMLAHVAQWDDNHRREPLLEMLAGLDDESFREAIGELLVAAHEEDSPLLDLHTFGRMAQERYAERRRQALSRLSNYDLMCLHRDVRWTRQNLAEDSDSMEPKKRAGYVCACIEVDAVDDEVTSRLGGWIHHHTICKGIPEPEPVPVPEPASAHPEDAS
jgi:hypothetical protein